MSNGRRTTLGFAPSQSLFIEYSADNLQRHIPFIIILLFRLSVLQSLITTYSYSTCGGLDPFLNLLFVQILAVSLELTGLLRFFPSKYHMYTSTTVILLRALWLYALGVFLMLAGLGAVFEASQVFSAKCLVAILIYMLSANIACVFMEHSKQIVFGSSIFKAVQRLPMQLYLISWA